MAGTIALLALLVSFLLITAPAHAYTEHLGFRATMIRRTEEAAATAASTTINFTRAAQQSHHRLSMLSSRLDTAKTTSSVNIQTPLKADGDGGGAYDMELSIGTPPQKLTALADTGSDLIWTKCGACSSCVPQGSPSYYPAKSSSFSKLPCSAQLCGALMSESPATTCGAGGAECDYKYSYGLEEDSDHYTQGLLGSETFTIGGDVVRGIGFGCTNMSEGGYGAGSGLVGLGRGALSLVSQLNAGAFSYCLTRDASKASPLLFGSLAALSGGGIQSTPLLPSGVYYIVGLGSISIDSTKTAGVVDGVVFDSGTTVTFLAEPAYTQAKVAVLMQTDLAWAADTDGFEACFYYDERSDGRIEDAVPSMVLHFDGGADMVLPVTNYFVDVGGGVLCWIVQKSSSVSIIGNVMQVDFHVLHDVGKSVLSFQPADCDSLSGSSRLLSKFQGIFLLTAAIHFLYTMFKFF